MKYKLNGQWYEIAVPSYDSTPVGTIVAYSGSTLPNGYMLCNGQSLLRTEYPDLFNVIGTTYGSVDSTHFNLPNIKGRILVGQDTSQTEFSALGKTGGEKTHTLTIDEMPSHSHIARSHVGSGVGDGMLLNGNSYTQDDNYRTASAGGGQAHNNLQPYIVVNYIIKAHPSAINTSEVVNEHSTSETDVYSANQTNVEIENAISGFKKSEGGIITSNNMSSFNIGSDTAKKYDLTFTNTYSEIPNVVVSYYNDAPGGYGSVNVAVGNITRTGCTLYFYVNISDQRIGVSYIVNEK